MLFYTILTKRFTEKKGAYGLPYDLATSKRDYSGRSILGSADSLAVSTGITAEAVSLQQAAESVAQVSAQLVSAFFSDPQLVARIMMDAQNA
jgi:hypothetical protein